MAKLTKKQLACTSDHKPDPIRGRYCPDCGFWIQSLRSARINGQRPVA